jgi:hypothetical protein
MANLPIIFPTAGEAAAAANTTRIAALFATAGLCQLAPPSDGLIWVSDTFVLKSGTILDLNGGTLKLATNSDKSVLKNENANTAAKAVTGNITSASLAGSGSNRFALSTVACTGHGFAVGSYVLIKGDTTKTYNGIHQVYSVPTANSFTFLMPDGNHAVIPGNSAGTITACQADAHITIRNGAIDYNEVADNSSGGINSVMNVFNRVGNLRMENMRLLGGNKYAVLGSNLWSPRFKDVYLDTGSDGLHFSGSMHDTVISGLTGRTGDDVVAWTHEEAEYPITDATPDEVIGMTIENVLMERSGSRGILLAPDADTVMAGIKMRNIGIMRGTGPVILLDSPSGASGTIRDISIDGLYGGYAADGVKLIGVGDNQAVTIDRMSVRGVRNAPGDTRLSGDVINVNSGSTISKLAFDDADVVLQTDAGDARALVYALAGSTVTELFFTNCKTDGLGTNDAAYKWARLNGDTSSFGRVTAIGGKIKGMGQMADHDSNISAMYVVTGGLVLDSFSSLLGGGKGFSALIDGIVALDMGLLLNLYGTSKTYNLRLKNIVNLGGDTVWSYGTTNTINLLDGDGSVKADGSKLTLTSGAIFYNTNAGYGAGVGLYAMGASATTRIAA